MNNPPKRKRFGFFSKLFLLLFFISICAFAYVSVEAWNFLYTPANKDATAFPVEIKQGSSLSSIANVLEEKNIITSAEKFQLYVKLMQKASNLQAGTFLLSPAWTPEKILEELLIGKVILHKITIREGLPWWEVADLLEEKGFCKAEDFTEIIHDKAFLEKSGIPFQNAEGFLYPDTYLLHKNEVNKDAAKRVATRLVNTFWEKTTPLFKEAGFAQGRPSPEKLKELVIMASIVERETRTESERPNVAGVYYNRLAINMILQADPTIIYGEGKDFKGPLLRRHLQNEKNPYNTYKINGLPPGPICSPSLSAMRASVFPAEHKYYYFVALGIGATHVFSTNLNDHNKAVRQYRQNIKNQK